MNDNAIDTISIDIVTSDNNSVDAIDSLISKLNELQTTLDKSDASKVINNLQKIIPSVNDLTNKLTQLNSITFDNLLGNLENLQKKAQSTEINIESNKDVGKSKKTQKKDENNNTIDLSLLNIFKTFKRVLGEILVLIGKINFSIAKNLVSAIGTAGKKMMALGGSVLKNITTNVGKFAASLLHIGTNSSKIENNIKGLINKLKLTSLALLGARSAFTAIRKASSEYMNYDTALSETLQNNWAVLGSIMSPILEGVISLFSKAVSYIASFIKVLTGIDVVARANTKALNKQSEAAKNVLSNLAKFDDLNTVDFNKGDDSSSPQLKVDTIDTSAFDIFASKIKENDWYGLGMEISRQFNEGLASINFDSVIEKASQFGTNISDLLNGLFDGMDWSQLGEKVGDGLQAIIAAVYNFIYGTNWTTLGSGLADALINTLKEIDFTQVGAIFISNFNVAIKTIAGFVSTPGIWNEIGTKFAQGFNGIFNNIDWNSLAMTIDNGIQGILDGTLVFLQNVDWEQIGLTIWDFVASIDWEGDISKFAETLGGLIAGIGKLLWGFIEIAVTDFSNYFSEKIEECGGFVISGLFKGIGDAMVGIGQWLIDHVFTPFIDGFKNIFGIHSPSTVMAEMGVYIIDGFKNGIIGIWDKVKDIFVNLREKIGNTFTNIVDDIKDIFSLDAIKEHFSNVVNSIKDTFANIPNWFKNKFTNAWQNVKNVFSTGGQIFSGIKEGISNVFANIVNHIIDGMNNVIAVPFKNINKMLNKIRNTEFLGISPFKNLWSENPLPVPQIPKLATGTNRIEYEGLYHLHKDEAVIPKKYNPAINNKGYEQNNDKVVNAIYTLIDVVENMETTNVINVDAEQVYKKTSKYANRNTNKYGVVIDDI